MPEYSHYEEFCLVLELYGHLLSLATRPISRGNDVAFHRAWNSVVSLLDILKQSEHGLISCERLEVVEHILRLSGAIPYKNRARTVLRLLKDSLTGQASGCAGYSRLRRGQFAPPPHLRRVVVALGPTIGLGDEFIVARAIAAKTSAAPMALQIETHHFELWECFNGPMTLLGAPPRAKFAFLSQLSAEEKKNTGLIHVDFLASDPTETPVVPSDLFAYVGRWVFGNATGVVVEPEPRRIHYLDCPIEFSLNRALQSDWMASRFISPSQTEGENHSWRARDTRASDDQVILLQVLTSKPRLLLSGRFYRNCFARLRELSVRRPFLVRILRGPARESGKITQQVYRDLAHTSRDFRVEVVLANGLKDVLAAMSKATLLFGPDTFTSHVAATMGIPQVTLILPEHHLWCNAASRSFYIKWGRRRDVVEAVAERMAYLLEDMQPEDAVLREPARMWRQCLTQLQRYIQSYPSRSVAGQQEAVAATVHTLRQLLQSAPEIMARTLRPRHLGQSIEELQSLIRHPDTMSIQSLVRLYHTIGVSDLSAVLFCLEWKETRHAVL